MSFGTILTVLLVGGYFAISYTSKKFAVQSAPTGDSADGVVGDDEQEGAEEFLEDNQTGEEAFLPYEVENTVYSAPSPARKNKPVSILAPAAEETTRQAFDLRQAVIAQVILNNDYINEISK